MDAPLLQRAASVELADDERLADRYWEEAHTQEELDSATLHWLLLSFNTRSLERGFCAFNFRRHRTRSEIVYIACVIAEVLAVILNVSTLQYDGGEEDPTRQHYANIVVQALTDPWSLLHCANAAIFGTLFAILWVERSTASGYYCCTRRERLLLRLRPHPARPRRGVRRVRAALPPHLAVYPRLRLRYGLRRLHSRLHYLLPLPKRHEHGRGAGY